MGVRHLLMHVGVRLHTVVPDASELAHRVCYGIVRVCSSLCRIMWSLCSKLFSLRTLILSLRSSMVNFSRSRCCIHLRLKSSTVGLLNRCDSCCIGSDCGLAIVCLIAATRRCGSGE